MVDRERLLVVLRERFRGASVQQFAEAANAIVALRDEWEEVRLAHAPTEGVRHGAEFRVFKKRCGEPDSSGAGSRSQS